MEVQSFKGDERQLSDAELAHLRALRSVADQLLGVLKGDRPDPACMIEAIRKLQECVMWAEKGIRIGVHF